MIIPAGVFRNCCTFFFLANLQLQQDDSKGYFMQKYMQITNSDTGNGTQ